jgi:hypothetical protein
MREDKMSPKGHRLAGTSGSNDEPPAVLCAICGTGIGTAAELAMTDAGPRHVDCQPTPGEADPRS